MLHFAVIRHESPQGVHWDLLLQVADVLKTWSLPQPPQPGLEIACRALSDHRLVYLDYEGPLSDDRGTVTRWDRGTYQIDSQTQTQLVMELAGERLRGRAVLKQTAEDPQRWQFSLAQE